MYIDFIALVITVSDFQCMFLAFYVHDVFCRHVFKRIWMNEWIG